MHLPKMSYVVKKNILIFLFVASAIGTQAQMAGVYTIDNTLPTGGTNYTSFTDAVSDLVALGINAAVTFNVTSGQTFNEQIDIPQITGSSATNTITVNGNTALLTFSPTSSFVPHTLRLSGADYMRFNNLRVIVSFNSNPGTALHLYNGSDYNIFDSVRCSAYLSNAPTVYIGPHATNQNLPPLYPSCDSNIFRNSQIHDGHIGIRITANAADSAKGNEVINCWIDDFTNTGIDVINGATACFISKNFFTNNTIRSNNQLYTGIRFTNTQKHTVSKNRMTADGTSGIFQNYNLGFCRGVWTVNSSNINIINNIMWQFEGDDSFGIDLANNSTNISVWHNSLSFFEFSSAKTGIRCQAVANNIQNNNIILGGSGGAYGLVLDSGNTVNYNNCFTPNAPFFAFGRINNINYMNLAAWQVASGYDANSTNLDPQWLFNFEVGNNNLFNTGTPLGVIDDFYDSVRSLVTPTVGAVESGCLPLGGTYTIDPLLPISATNYQTFNAAVADLCNCGIAAPVIFNVATAQSFTEQVDICEVVGASAVNTITFNGNGSMLSHTATTSSDRHTLRLSGSDFIRFNNLIFNVGGSIYGHGVHLHNQANNNIFDNCTVQMSTTSTSATLNGFVISTQPEFLGITGPSAGSDSNLFSNNTIIGGDKGIAFYGSSTDRPLNNVATNNTVQDFREYGIRCTNTAGSILDSNDISRPTRTLFSDFYGIRLGADFSSVVRKNHIHNPFQANGNSTMTFYGLYFAGNVLPGNDNSFVNNLIEDVNSRGAQHGVYLSSSARRVRVQHNTLDLSGTAFPTGSAITYGINYLGSSGNTFDIRNNNVSITRAGTIAKYGIQVGSAAGSGATISNNNVYINGLGTSNAYGRFNGINYPMLTNWQTANVGAWGQNSTEVDPQYVNPSIDDYNPSNLSMDNTGAPLSVTDDIENTTRSATAPDAGAFEFGCNGLSTIVTNFVSPTDTTISCFGVMDGQVQLSASLGLAPYSYTLLPSTTNNSGSFTGLDTGFYNVVVYDALGCTDTVLFNVTQPTPLLIDSISTIEPICSIGNDGSILVNATGGTMPYQYNIGGADQASNSFTNLNGGSFTVTVTDANNCSLTSTANISSATSPTIDSVSVTEASCNPGCDATAIINITPGTSAAITYSTNGIAYQGANNYGSLCANNYTAYIQDANGCTDTLAFGITTATTPTIDNISLTPTICIGDSNAAATVLASGGNGVLTYSLNPTSQSNTTGNFIGLYATNYIVSVVDAHGCQVDSNFTILNAPSLVWDSIIVTDALCFGDSNGTITVTTSGGIGTILYGVSPIASTNTSGLFNSLAGNVTYTILATDANGCSINTTTFVAEPIAVGDSTVQVTNVTCAGANDGSFSLQGTGGTPAYSYNVMPGNLNNNTGSFTNLSGNTYTVTITDANNCSHTTTITIVEPTSVFIDSTSITDVSCNGLSDGELFVSASGGVGNFNFNLMPGNLMNATGIYNGLIANIYTVTATEGNGCSVSTSLTVNEPLPIVIDSLSITNVSCHGLSDGAITVVSSGGNGGNTYLLNPGNVTSGSGTFVNLAANIYTMTLTDSLGCSVSIVDSVTEPLPLTASFTTDSVSCFGGSDGQIQMSTAGGTQPYSLTITPGATTNNTGLFTGLTAGSYTVSVLDGSGCPLTVDSIMVNQPAQILFTSVNTVDVTCFGDSTGEISVAAAGGTGNITFSLSPNMGTQSPSGNFTGLAAMTYIVIATDANNCSATTSVTIDQNPEIQLVSFNYTELICHGDSSGSLSFTAVGGVGTLTYSFDGSPFNTDTAYNNLPAGDYPLSIQDVLGCQVDTNLILTEPDPVGVGSVSITPTTCADSEDGIIKIQAIGGRPFYTYYRRPGISFNRTGRLPKLGVGYYTITIRDSSGCEYDTVFTITSNSNPIQTQITKSDLPCQGYGNEGRARVDVQGGVPPYAYLWSSTPAQNQAEAIGLQFGYYSVEVIDGAGCKVVDTTYINPGDCCIEIFIPNAFSPNGDGRNDEFRVIGTAGIKLRQFEIFNRWGQKVWETYNSTDSWNGIYKGEEQPVADYYYVFRYQCTTDGKEYIKKGNLTLIR